MHITEILAPGRVLIDVDASSKKSVLESLAGLIAEGQPEVAKGDVFDNFVARERLGSTALGRGVAIPHCRVEQADHTRAAFIRTRGGVDFDAMDGKPVDLFFALAVPAESTQEHLDILAELAGMFSDDLLVTKLRSNASADEVFRLVTGWNDAA